MSKLPERLGKGVAQMSRMIHEEVIKNEECAGCVWEICVVVANRCSKEIERGAERYQCCSHVN